MPTTAASGEQKSRMSYGERNGNVDTLIVACSIRAPVEFVPPPTPRRGGGRGRATSNRGCCASAGRRVRENGCDVPSNRPAHMIRLRARATWLSRGAALAMLALFERSGTARGQTSSPVRPLAYTRFVLPNGLV